MSVCYLFFQQNIVHGLALVNYPDVCTSSPEHGKAFCNEHVKYLKEKHTTVPAGIHEFLRYCGVHHDNTSTSVYRCIINVNLFNVKFGFLSPFEFQDACFNLES